MKGARACTAGGRARQPAARPVAMPAWRHHAVVVVFLLLLGALAWRAAYLVTTERSFLVERGEVRALRNVQIPVYRGMIFDRHGEPLAVSAPMHTVWMDPGLARLDAADRSRLAEALGVSAETLARRLESGSPRFAYLARRVSPEVGREVASLAIDGVQVGRSYHRFYPAGETVAHVVGRTDIDDVGQNGIERAFEAHLAGTPGLKSVLRDVRGRTIEDVALLRAPEYGKDVHLTLDLRLQFLAYRELKAAVLHHGAEAGALVMLDVATGDVLALANQPSYNPNDWAGRGRIAERNVAIANLYEPGSTIKPIAVLAALEAGFFSRDSEIDTAPGYFQIGSKTIEDPVNYEVVTVGELLAKSSQVGIARMALAMPERTIFDALARLGFGEPVGSGLPEEAVGGLHDADLDKPIGRAVLAYGYGLTATPLELARAYLTLASGGVAREVSALRDVRRPPSRRVFARQPVAEVAAMLRGVVEPGGTAPRGRPVGYSAAGKTGTVRKVTADGYDDTRHVALFAGFAPSERPRIVVAVVVDQPRRNVIGGGQVAAPVFARVVARALRLLGEPPRSEPVASA